MQAVTFIANYKQTTAESDAVKRLVLEQYYSIGVLGTVQYY